MRSALDDGVIERRGRQALAGDFRGDTLKNLRRQVRVDENGQLRLAQHVDETRRDHLPARIDAALCRGAVQAANGSDAAITDANVRGVPR